MRVLRAIAIFILAALVLLVEGIAFLALTETGTQWLFTQMTHMAPGKLQVKQVEGRLGRNLTLTGLRYHTPNFTLTVEYLNFSWRPAALLEGTLWIEQLHLREVTWHQEHQSTEKTTALPEIALPLKVVAESVQIQNLSLQPLESPPMVINTITLKGNFNSQILTIVKLGVSAPEGQLQVSGQVTPHDDYPLELAFQWRAPTARLGAVTGHGQLEGNLRRLTLHQEVQTPFQLRLRGRFFDLLGQLRWVAAIEIPETKLQQVSSQLPPIRLGLDLEGAGGLERFKIRGSYQIQGPKFGQLTGKLFGEQLAKGHWALHQLSAEQVQGPGNLTLHGNVVLVEDQPQFTFQGQWQDLAWPLVGTADFSSQKGQVSLNGSTDNYHLKVKTALAGQTVPTGEWSLVGVGDTTQFKLEQLQGHLLDGILSGAGNLRWDPAPAWNLQLAGNSLNPGKQWPEWPGKLTFSVVTRGTLKDKGRALMINIQDLSGSLRDYPVSAQGRVQLQNTTWRITDLKFHSGDSQVSIGGTVSKRLALDWQLVSPDLSQLAPTAQGSISAKGHLGGQLKLPKLIFHLQGRKLAYQDFQIASVTANIDLDSQGKRPSQLLLKATDLRMATQAFHSLNIEGSGTPLRHELSLSVRAPKRSLKLAVEGAWKEPVWQGEIRNAQLTDSTMGHWEMKSPTPLKLSRDSMDLSLWCWQQQAAQLCLGGHWQQGKTWQGNLNITALPLAIFSAFLPEKTTVEGTIAGSAQVHGEAHQLMQARMNLSASAGRLTQVTPEGETLVFPHRGLQAKLHLGKEAGEGNVRLLLAEPGAAPLSVSLRFPPAPLNLTALDQLPLNGRVTMAFDDLAFLETLVPELQAVHGQLRVDLKLAGRVTAPQLLGYIVLEKGGAQIPMLGLDLTGIQLQVKAREEGRIAIKGEVHSGQGQLTLNGQARLDPAAGWPASLTISGRRFEAMNTAEVKVFISPHLRVTASKEAIRVGGEVVIPEATIVVKDIKRRGGVPVSKDVVIISKEKKSTEKTSAIPIYARVRIILGDKVTVQAFGFKGGVAGNLLVTETPGKPTRGSGEIRVVDGQYKAYGQQLDIRQGRAIFAGPIENPQLNVEAVRTIENSDVVAGVRIRGSASAPVMTLFSEPPMNESDILAYLILGRPLTSASGDEGELLAKAATSLGLAGGSILAQSIGKAFGLENVGIEKMNGETQSTALMLGKHLSPRLYIGYGIGIFQRFNAFLMRYTLSKHWSLQAETGLESGVDVFYNLER